MIRLYRVTILAVSCALFAFGTITLTSFSARAQTMGEYGLATGHAAAAGSSMPSIGAPDISAHPNPESGGGGNGGQNQTEEVQTYDAPNQRDAAQDDSDSDSSGDWQQQNEK